MTVFDVLDTGSWFTLADKGRVLATELPVDFATEAERYAFVGSTVRIGGQLYRVRGVELFMHAPPWRAGEKCGLLVEPIVPGASPASHACPDVPRGTIT